MLTNLLDIAVSSSEKKKRKRLKCSNSQFCVRKSPVVLKKKIIGLVLPFHTLSDLIGLEVVQASVIFKALWVTVTDSQVEIECFINLRSCDISRCSVNKVVWYGGNNCSRCQGFQSWFWNSVAR